ncbi:MAG TPA: hypothetical protein PKM63_21800 [Panacibacter sp.]|nr:hypothetical protein [Panacibacter sp.]HNP46947.1 hypothetical protein [Panacibacter sp.]
MRRGKMNGDNNMMINIQQNRILHSLLHKAGMMANKPDLVNGFTDGRTEHSSEMLATEAQEMINYLSATVTNDEYKAANHMRRKILAICHKLRWEHDTGAINMESVNKFCISRSYLKKPLNDYSNKELPKLVSQFQQVYNSLLKKV